MENIVWKDIEDQAALNIAGLVYRSEKYFDNQVEELARAVFNDKRIKIVFVAGPSSSGKTTFSKLLQHDLRALGIMAHYVGLDDYFINRADLPVLPSGLKDFDSIHAIDLPLVHQAIQGIMNDEWIEVPKYNFLTGKREDEHFILKLMPSDVVIIEGIHGLNPIFSGQFADERSAKVALMPMRGIVFPSGRTMTCEELRLLRRGIRDVNSRGYSFEDTAKQWKEVRAVEEKLIYPYMKDADFKIDSGHPYELFLYKKMAWQHLKDSYSDEFANIRACMTEVSNRNIPEIPATSLLNEFVTFKRVDF